MKTIKYILIISMILSSILFKPKNLHASFMATPMEFHLNVKSGEAETHSFKLYNGSKQEIRVKLYTGDFKPTPEAKEAFLKPGTIKRSCANWIELETQELDLMPGKTQNIKFKLNVPIRKAGDYWSMLFIEQTTKPAVKNIQKEKQNFSINTFQRVGIRIFEQAIITTPPKGTISLVEIKKDKEKDELFAYINVQNEGNTILHCSGYIKIKNAMGAIVLNIPIEKFRNYVGIHRYLKIPIKEKLTPGQYIALAVIDYGQENMIAGETMFEIF